MTTEYAVEHARWQVLWVVTKPKRRIVVIECENNLAEARRIYQLAKDSGKHYPTLRSANVAFPPPEKIEEKIHAYNRQMVFWCPFCMELRRFTKFDGFHSELSGAWVEVPQFYCCPMCDISIHHGQVKQYNPRAAELAVKSKRLRRGKSSGRTRRRRRV